MTPLQRKLFLVFSDASPIWAPIGKARVTPPLGLSARFKVFCREFQPPTKRADRILPLTLKRWYEAGPGAHPRRLDAFCALVNRLGNCKLEEKDFFESGQVDVDTFAGKLRIEIGEAHYLIARERMRSGCFFPAAKHMAPKELLGPVARTPQPGLYVVERFSNAAHAAAHPESPQSRCLLVIERLMTRDVDQGECGYVRFFVHAGDRDPIRTPVEYEGTRVLINGLTYMLLHCHVERAKDLIFMILDLAQDQLSFSGHYLSDYIDEVRLPESRYVKIVPVADVRVGDNTCIADAIIARELERLFGDDEPKVTTRPQKTAAKKRRRR